MFDETSLNEKVDNIIKQTDSAWFLLTNFTINRPRMINSRASFSQDSYFYLQNVITRICMMCFNLYAEKY